MSDLTQTEQVCENLLMVGICQEQRKKAALSETIALGKSMRIEGSNQLCLFFRCLSLQRNQSEGVTLVSPTRGAPQQNQNFVATRGRKKCCRLSRFL
jgi:hypothetical protein